MLHSCLEVHSRRFRGADRPITWLVWEVERAAAFGARLASAMASSCVEEGNKGSQSLSAPRAPPFQLLLLGCYGNSSLWGDLAIFISGLTASPSLPFASEIITCQPRSCNPPLPGRRPNVLQAGLSDWPFMRLVVLTRATPGAIAGVTTWLSQSLKIT